MRQGPLNVLFGIDTNWTEAFVGGEDRDIFVVFYLVEETLLLAREVRWSPGGLEGCVYLLGECADAGVDV